MERTSSGSLAAIGRQLRWFAWSLGAPLDPRWAVPDRTTGRRREHGGRG